MLDTRDARTWAIKLFPHFAVVSLQSLFHSRHTHKTYTHSSHRYHRLVAVIIIRFVGKTTKTVSIFDTLELYGHGQTTQVIIVSFTVLSIGSCGQMVNDCGRRSVIDVLTLNGKCFKWVGIGIVWGSVWREQFQMFVCAHVFKDDKQRARGVFVLLIYGFNWRLSKKCRVMLHHGLSCTQKTWSSEPSNSSNLSNFTKLKTTFFVFFIIASKFNYFSETLKNKRFSCIVFTLTKPPSTVINTAKWKMKKKKKPWSKWQRRADKSFSGKQKWNETKKTRPNVWTCFCYLQNGGHSVNNCNQGAFKLKPSANL